MYLGKEGLFLLVHALHMAVSKEAQAGRNKRCKYVIPSVINI